MVPTYCTMPILAGFLFLAALRIRITLVRIQIRHNFDVDTIITLMRIRILILADADPACHPDSYPDPGSKMMRIHADPDSQH
jgi:hypothetical protein